MFRHRSLSLAGGVTCPHRVYFVPDQAFFKASVPGVEEPPFVMMSSAFRCRPLALLAFLLPAALAMADAPAVAVAASTSAPIAAPAPGSAAAPLAAVVPLDPVARLLQRQLQGQLGQPAPLPLDASALPRAVAGFYADRQWAPAWDEPRFQALLRSLAALEGDGLRPADYALPALQRLAGVRDPAQLAEREVLATHSCLLALLHLYRGKTDPQRLDAHWNFSGRRLAPAVALREVAAGLNGNQVEELFDQARPAWGAYNHLRIALAQLRQLQAAGGWPAVPAGPTLKPGMSDSRVPLLRQRMVLAGLLPATAATASAAGATAAGATAATANAADGAAAAAGGNAAAAAGTVEWVYDAALLAAVQRFQRESNLQPDGGVGPATRAELNVPVAARIEQLRANLERVRWFQNRLDAETVIVDIAGYRIYYLRDGEVTWQSRVQVGREYRPSPIFQAAITYLTLSPSWVVPPTILQEDSLPAIRRNPRYLAKNRLHVYDAAGQRIAPGAVNWWRPGRITLRQEPGPNSSLGEVVVRFDNPYAVYLHDTPHKQLFDASNRATSSGCIRVENIHELAVLLLDDPAQWSRERLQEAINTRVTRKVTLGRAVPILMAYWTAQVDPDGYIAFRPDVYKRDAPLLQALDAAP